MLFEEYKYFDYQFPEPQYLGAKHTHLSWISQFVPTNIKTTFDAFAGSQSVSFLFKQMGFQTLTNDFLNFNNQIGKALIENKSEKLNDDDIKTLFQKSPNKINFTLMETVFTDVFFEKEETVFIDNFRANIQLLKNEYKQALAFAVMNRSLTRKITMGHFGHMQALVYANDPERIKRNRSLIRPIKDLFLELLHAYNNAVFDNGQRNKSFNQNILDLLPQLSNIDLVYFDPPYCDSHADYQGFYHLLETYTEYWKDKEFVNGIKRYEPKRYSGFDRKSEAITSFEKLFELSTNIPYWLISYNNRSYPNIAEFKKIISKYRSVEIEYKTYQNDRGGKGSVAGSQEILFVCKPKKNILYQL
jgi:adenine-specific DNA methylase